MKVLKKAAVTWTKLVALEPRLQAIHDEAVAYFLPPDEQYHCQQAVRLRKFQRRIEDLVGWSSVNKNHPVLGSHLAHQLVTEMVLNAIPPCRICLCMAIEE